MFTRDYWNRDSAGSISGHRPAIRWRSRGRLIQLFGPGARNNSNRPLGRLTAADHMELVCDGYDDGGSVHALHGPRQFARQYIATARGQGPEHTNAGDIDRGSRGYARAWRDWPICRPDRAFDRLAADCGLDTRRAERRESGSVNLAKNQSRERAD